MSAQPYAGLLRKLLFKVPAGHADFKLVNPDGPEAAEAISSLLKALEELLAASERHIFGEECKAERDASRAAINAAKGGA